VPTAPDAQHLPKTAIAELLQQRANAAERLRQCRQQCQAFIRQGKATWKPPKERHTHALFQIFDVLADRGLRDVQLVGGPREAQVARGHLKGAQGVQGEGASVQAQDLLMSCPDYCRLWDCAVFLIVATLVSS
jgi:hypothetical protein